MHANHRHLHKVSRSSLQRGVDSFALGSRAQVVIAIVNVGYRANATEHGSHQSRFAHFFGRLFHVAAHARVGLVIILNRFLCFRARKSGPCRKTERADIISDCKVDYLRKPSRFRFFLLCLRAEHRASRARVNVFAFVERFGHNGIARQVREQSQFDLRIVG